MFIEENVVIDSNMICLGIWICCMYVWASLKNSF